MTKIIIAMWVDDLIIFGKNMISINKLKAQLNEEYELRSGLGSGSVGIVVIYKNSRQGKFR